MTDHQESQPKEVEVDSESTATRRRWNQIFYTSSATLVGTFVVGAALQVPAVRDFGVNLVASLPSNQAPSFNMANCSVDASETLPSDGTHATKIARLFGIPIVGVGNTVRYSAACPPDTDQEIREQGTVIGNYTVHPTEQTGVSYRECAVFGIKHQTDHTLQAHQAPMVLVCEDATQVFAYA
jgi:hypothetical protein